MCFKIIKGKILSHCRFFVLSDCMQSRGHMYKLYKQQASVDAYKFSLVTVFVTYVMLCLVIVECSSSAIFKRLMDSVDFVFFIFLLFEGMCKWL